MLRKEDFLLLHDGRINLIRVLLYSRFQFSFFTTVRHL